MVKSNEGDRVSGWPSLATRVNAAANGKKPQLEFPWRLPVRPAGAHGGTPRHALSNAVPAAN